MNPRGITFGPDGRLYVAEAGTGGPDTPDVGPRGRRYRMGSTARVSRVDLQGNREIVLDKLPSFSNGDDELGATGLAFLDDTLYVLTATGGYEIGDPAWDNVVLRVNLRSSPALVTPVFNLTTYNLANPSLSRQLDPVHTDVAGGVPFGLTALDGALYATDGNQEHVTRITPEGQAQRILQYPASDHVLTGIAVGPEQALYVAEFGPAPHQENSARITRLTTDGQASVAATGLENAIDVTFDSKGQLYVLELSRPGVRIAQSGRALRFRSDGDREIVASGLNYPTAMVFGPDENLYVTNNGHRGTDSEGEILKVPLAPPSRGLTSSEVSFRLLGAALVSVVVGGGVYLLSRR